jgi:AcrR family transcriptional regulator
MVLPATVQGAVDARPLWQRETPVGRDRRTQLSPEQIAHTAFAVAEVESLQAVSIKRIATRLGIPAPRLQGYLADRSELLDLMVDVALGEIDFGDGSGDWHARLQQLARVTRGAVARHPWLSGLLGLRAPSGPNGLEFTEQALRAVDGLGLDIATMARCVDAVLTFVCGSVRPTGVSGPGASRSAAPALAAYLAEAVSPESFPALHRLLDEGASMSGDESFEAGLAYLLDGMALMIEQRRA